MKLDSVLVLYYVPDQIANYMLKRPQECSELKKNAITLE